MLGLLMLLLPVLGTAVQAAPWPTHSNHTAPSSEDACASVAKRLKSSKVDTVPAEMAYDCLNSIPFHKSAALDLMKSIRPYLEWQTTLSYVKDPPKEYATKVQPAYDFWEAFNAVQHNVIDEDYKSEYDFGWDLFQAFQRVHDGHFGFLPDSVGGLFQFERTTPLVSVSEDGKQLPLVYAYTDILASKSGNSTFEPSAITFIDGQNATEFLEDWSQYGSSQDKDALWNSLFYSPAQMALGQSGTGTGIFSGRGNGAFVYPGASTTYSFANGTDSTHENVANVMIDFYGIKSGTDLYEEYLTADQRAYANTLKSSEEDANDTFDSVVNKWRPDITEKLVTKKTTLARNYPSPVLSSPGNINAGYFIDRPGFEHVAVLSISSFVGMNDIGALFQSVNEDFIAAALAANKTKLIIDLSANHGGVILQAYDLYKQLFPRDEPYGATRFRAHETLDKLGEIYSEAAAPYDRDTSPSNSAFRWVASQWNYRSDVDVDGEPFPNWSEKYGPHHHGPGNDTFTSIVRWNLTDPLNLALGGIEVTGYMKPSNITQNPFKPEDIILVYDGYCASTCAIFTEFMRRQAGVKSIALGGRPNTDLMQAVGGVKGTGVLTFDYIFNNVATALSRSNSSLLDKTDNAILSNYTRLPMARSVYGVVNLRDGIGFGDEDNLPLQFVYEPAECRIFYTPDMVVDQSAVWRVVADTVWGEKNACIVGANNFSGDKESTVQGISADIDIGMIWEGLQKPEYENYLVNLGWGDCITLP